VWVEVAKVMAPCSTYVEVEVWRHILLTPATDEERGQIRAHVALFSGKEPLTPSDVSR
jgi:hypothetical protein